MYNNPFGCAPPHPVASEIQRYIDKKILDKILPDDPVKLEPIIKKRKVTGVNRQCPVCKKIYYVKASLAHKSKTCSRECSDYMKTCKFKDTLLP